MKLYIISIFIFYGVNLYSRTIPTTAQEQQAILGKGYDVKKEKFVGDCVTGSVVYVGAQESSINFERSLSQQELFDSLGFSSGLKARYGLYKLSTGAKFATESSSDDYSESTIYSAVYKMKNAKLIYNKLTDVGKVALPEGQNFTWDRWEQTCGHEYVEQIQLGAKIMISAKVDFSTKEDKQSFSAYFKIKGPAFSATAELQKASRYFGKRASVTIRALQLGGDVTRLSRIFGTKRNNSIIKNGNNIHALLACSMDNIDACVTVLNQALRYATDTDDEEAFPNQIKPDEPLGSPKGPAQLAYITGSWTDLAFYPPPPVIKNLVKVAREELSQTFNETLNFRNRIFALLTSPVRLSPAQKLNISAERNNVNSNLVKIYNTAMTCYTEVEKCVVSVNNLRKDLKYIDESRFEIYPEVFAQWCDSLTTNTISFSESHTINSLIDLLKGDYDLDSFPDLCQMGQKILLEKEELNISDMKIKSLKPLETFTNLKRLIANRNKISDIRTLQKLKNLKTLKISSNRITTLKPLTRLKKLEELHLESNYIEEVEDLHKFKKLKNLRLGGNMIKEFHVKEDNYLLERLRINNNEIFDITNFSKFKNLKYLDISYNNIADINELAIMDSLELINIFNNPIERIPDILRDKIEVMY